MPYVNEGVSSTIRAVIFDVGGVLLTLGEAAYRQEAARRLGLHELPPQYLATYPALQRGEVPEEEVWARIAGRPVPPDAFDDAFRAHFHPVPGMLALAGELRAMGLSTAILSNTQTSHIRVIRTMGILDGFEPIAISCEIGHRKPEPGAFQYVLDRLGLSAGEVAYVDDLPEYVEAGRALGLQATWHRGDTELTRRALLNLITI